MPIKRTILKSTETYCSTHDLSFKGKTCPICRDLPKPRPAGDPNPDEQNVLDPEYMIGGTNGKIETTVCPCGALRVLPLLEPCPLCGRDVPR
jgi:hypothetical protein